MSVSIESLKRHKALSSVLFLTLLLSASHQNLLAWHYSSDYGELHIEVFSALDLHNAEIFSDFDQDHYGNTYVASNRGLHSYDGETWQTLPETSYNPFTSAVHVCRNQRVWVGGLKHFGYYELSPEQGPVFNDLTKELLTELEGREIGYIWEIHSTENDLCIVTSHDVLWKKNEKWQRHGFEVQRRILPTWIDGTLFIHARGDGLYKITAGGCMKAIDESSELTSGIIRVLSADEPNFLFMTVGNGLWKYTSGRLEPHLDDLAAPNEYNNITIPLSDGSIAKSDSSSVRIISSDGQLLGETPEGLGNIYELKQLNDGSIWVGTDKSLFRIHPNTPRAFGLSAISIVRNGSTLYVSDGEQLSQLTQTEESVEKKKLTEGQLSSSMISLEDGTIYGKDLSMYLIKDGKKVARSKLQRVTYYKSPSRYANDQFYTLNAPGVSRWRLSPDRELVKLQSVNSKKIFTYHAEVSPSISMVSSNSNSVGLIHWSEGTDDAEFELLDSASGLPEDTIWTQALQVGSKTALATDKGLYHYQHKKKRFLPIEVLGPYQINGASDLTVTQTETQQGAILHFNDNSDPSGYRIGHLEHRDAEGFLWKEFKLPRLSKVGRVKSLLHEHRNGREILWVGGTTNLFRYDITEHEIPATLNVNLTSVSETTRRKTHYSGFGVPPRNNVWPFPQQSVNFHYAAPPALLNQIGYQTRLIGFSDQWSDINTLSFREFNNLREGHYTFEVQAIDEFGRAGPITSFTFTILPPWYRSILAYIAYALSALGAIFLITRWWVNRLRRRNIELETLVNQRTSELERSNQKLRRANAVKQDFLASMSHEIRNPLNGILGIARLMKDQAQHSQQDDESLTHLVNCASHLHQLLGEVLDYSSLEAGKLQAKKVSFNPLTLTDEVCSMHRTMASDKGLQLRMDLPELEHEWLSDPVLLRQVLINLVSNAIKYTPNGSVEIRLKCEGDSATFSVTDTGPGIPKEKQHEIFEKFTRLSKAGESQIAGTGLGLAIASQMAVLLGGKLALDQNYKQGARFCLRLSVAMSDQPITIEKTQKTPFCRPFRSLRVLIADDMEFNRYINSKLLEQLGANTKTVGSGQSAIDELTDSSYDLALLDINMPDMTGIEVVKQYLKSSPVQPPKLIALSAHNTEKMQGACLVAGFDYFVEKPLNPDVIESLVSPRETATRAAKGSLLDYLADQDPNAKKALVARFADSIQKELDTLKKAIRAGSTESQSASLHKIKGLIALRQSARLSSAFGRLERAIQSDKDVPQAILEFEQSAKSEH